MPELPDVEVYIERLNALFGGKRLSAVRLKSPFLLRTAVPPLSSIHGQVLRKVFRLGKRLVFEFDGNAFLVLHLMIAGRLRLRALGYALKAKSDLAAFDFPEASLLLTEASAKKRASLHLVEGQQSLSEFDRGGVEPLLVREQEFAQAILRENRTLKRALTDPEIMSGIGNAYSDEILHRAGLSPGQRTQNLKEAEITALYQACRSTLSEWLGRLRAEVGEGFPEKVTAFREGMAAHGRYQKPCPVCRTPIQRIRYANNECNYCPSCQTDGKLLADRGLSRLLGQDFPRSLEEMEEHKALLRRS